MHRIAVKKKGKMYECQVFFPSGYPKKWKYITDLSSFTQFLNKSHSGWKYFNVYEKGTKQYLKRFYPNNAVPKTLGLLLLLGASLLTQKFTFSNTFSLSASSRQTTPMKNTFSKTTLSETTSTKTTFTNDFNYPATIPTLKGGVFSCI